MIVPGAALMCFIRLPLRLPLSLGLFLPLLGLFPFLGFLARLGAFATHHFSWGGRSVLNHLSDERASASQALATGKMASLKS